MSVGDVKGRCPNCEEYSILVKTGQMFVVEGEYFKCQKCHRKFPKCKKCGGLGYIGYSTWGGRHNAHVFYHHKTCETCEGRGFTTAKLRRQKGA